MGDKVINIVGASGSFLLATPFDNVISPNDRYTIQAIRSISDYLNNDLDPKNEIYLAHGLSEEDWESDRSNNVDIITLQSDGGHQVSVPSKYVIRYPDANGIPYQTYMLAVGLPAMEVNKDYGFLINETTEMIKRILGVEPKVELLETSRVALVPESKHKETLALREVSKQSEFSYRVKYNELLQTHNETLERLHALEEYIKKSLTP